MLEGSQDLLYIARGDQILSEAIKVQNRVKSMGEEKCGALIYTINTVKLRLGKKFDYLALYLVL